MTKLLGVVEQLKKERTRLTDELHRVTAALTAFGNVYISGSQPNKRRIPAAGLRRIAAAQRARWAKAKGQAVKPRRTISAPKKIAAA